MVFYMRAHHLVKVRTGLLHGVLVRFYKLEERVPEDVAGHAIAEKVIPSINHVWVGKPHEKVDKRYLAEFQGYIMFPESGAYRLFVVANNGVKLWLGKRNLLSSWTDSPTRRIDSEDLNIQKGYYKIRLLHYSKHGFSELRLGWVKPDRNEEIIPSSNLAFSIGDRLFLKIPTGFSAVLVPTSEEIREKHCMSFSDICVVEIPYDEQPLYALISIYNEKGVLVYRSTEPLELWGGDFLELRGFDGKAVI